MDFKAVESKWQKRWEKAELGRPAKKGKKFFMHFAYPGISGYQHVGHMRGFTYTDVICRYKRMTGHSVFFPVGTHATGNQAIGFANKVRNRDEKWLSYLAANGYPMDNIKDLEDVGKVVSYFNQNYIDNWKRYGFLADWNSFTCTVFPEYGKFIEWQFKKLNGAKLLVKKPYFATFCPNCGPVAVDPSETDISKGGGAQKHEYTLIKFKLKDAYLVAATLRPETMYGQTNLWVDPAAEYSMANIGDEIWICSPQCVEKLKNQKDGVREFGKICGDELIGKQVNAPAAGRKIPILPCKFCDPNVGTGIVTSVPSDAPYDYMALRDLQKDGDTEALKIKPIPIIASKDYGELPAVTICEDMKIKDQNDPRLEEATKIIYKTGFHTGVMNKNCGEFAGMPVEKAKELVKKKLIKEGSADILYDLSEEVVCRCGGTVVIKKVPDQWFIKYSDKKLTESSKKHANTMKICPQEYADNLPGVLDWFQDRACARLGNWLGTKLPFDPRWTIEPIADSTLYPAYYVVSRFVNAKKLKLADLTEEFFDYVFLGKGRPKNGTWKDVKEEFDYWYPVDMNLGGKEHQTVHFPVYIMNHVAVLRKEHWPRGIFVNYWITGEGGKISKSKGGAAATPQEAANMYGVDTMRLFYSHVGSPHADILWNEDTVVSYKSHIHGIHETVKLLKDMKGTRVTGLEKWLLSRANSKLKEYVKHMDDYNLRKAVDLMLFDFEADLNRYQKRGGECGKAVREALEIWLKALTPFVPHVCEECWEMLGNKDMISKDQLPKVAENKIDARLEAEEDYVHTVLRDIDEIRKIAKIEKPSKISIFVTPEWKYKVYEAAAEGTDLKKIMQTPLKKHGNALVGYFQKLLKRKPLDELQTTAAAELDALKASAKFIESEHGCKVEVDSAERVNHPKASSAEPGKPGILIE